MGWRNLLSLSKANATKRLKRAGPGYKVTRQESCLGRRDVFRVLMVKEALFAGIPNQMRRGSQDEDRLSD